MREIKFRGKSIETNEWVYGYYGEKINVKTGNNDSYIIIPTYTPATDSSYFYDVQVIPETAGQFTGLQDKNGVDIYESDEVKAVHRNYENEDHPIGSVYKVKWLNGCFMFGNWNAHEFFNSHTRIEVVTNK